MQFHWSNYRLVVVRFGQTIMLQFMSTSVRNDLIGESYFFMAKHVSLSEITVTFEQQNQSINSASGCLCKTWRN